MLLPAIILAYSGLLFFSYATEGILLFELIIMLLPYWLLLNLGLVVWLLYTYVTSQAYQPSVILRVSTLVLGLVSGLLFARFINFTYIQTAEASDAGVQSVKVAFFNKLFSNKDYKEIDKTLNTIKPDIIGFSEMKLADKSKIASLSTYRCSLSKNARDGATISLFSKYPCQINNEFDSTYVLSATMQMHGKTHKVFVIHPVPPSTQAWVTERNNELGYLADYVATLPENEVIIMGDFNVSPWSRAFSQISSLAQIKNVARGMGIYSTWHGPFLRTQIDHIFVPMTATVESFDTIRVKGSDHNLIWSQVRI